MMRSLSTTKALTALVVLHVVTYFSVYFQQKYFLGDFAYTYHGLVFFFTQAFSQVGFPEWNPYQKGGYPTLLSLQTGYLYPVHWLLAFSKIPFTLSVASILQSLHVLFGAVGGFFLFRRLCGNDVFLGLLGGIAFQFFGGFYSNVEHPDFIRAFAFVPWILLLLSPKSGEKSILSYLRLNRSYLATPLMFFFCTGAYPGMIISVGVCSAFYALLFSLTVARRSLYLAVLGFFGLGLLASLVHFVPALALNDFQLRSAALTNSEYHRMSWMNFLSLVLSQLQLEVSADLTMASLYVTVPLLISALYFRIRKNLELLPLVAVGLFALVMAWGPDTLFWRLLTETFPILKRSRFPIGEYRVYFSLAVIALGLGGIRSLHAQAPKYPLLPGLCFALGLAGIFYAVLPQQNRFISSNMQPVLSLETELLLVAAAVFGTLVAIRLFAREPRSKATSLLAPLLLVSVVCFDGIRFSTAMRGYELPNPLWREIQGESDQFVKRGFGRANWDISSRPKRRRGYQRFSDQWQGYFTGFAGDFRLDDYGAPLTKFEANCATDKFCSDYMAKSWTPLFLPSSISLVDGVKSLSPDRLLTSSPGVSVKTVQYGIESITYRIHAPEPVSFVENEYFFPGWSGKIRGQETTIAAKNFSYFRYWELPAGDYDFEARFRFPRFRPLLLLTAGISALWACSVFLILRQRVTKNSKL